MGLIKAFTGSLSGTVADQWKDIITSPPFDELVVVSPGILKQPLNNRGTQNKATEGVISNGSKIYVPENTVAFIFNQSGIEEIINEPGGYEFTGGSNTIFNKNGFKVSIIDEALDRFKYGGQTDENRKIAFVNLREIRGLKYGTRNPLIYHDSFYESDLEITAFGEFSIKVTDPVKFITNFIPANYNYYSFSDYKARSQITSEFIHSLTVGISSLSTKHRISHLPAKLNELNLEIKNDKTSVGSWKERFGFEIINIAIESIELSKNSKKFVEEYSSKRMDWKVLENVRQETSNIAAQQNISKGIKEHGLGDMPGMALGMGIVNGLNPTNVSHKQEIKKENSFDEQIKILKQFKELFDEGIITEEEFEMKKKEIMNL